jgi:hypothetical protein
MTPEERLCEIFIRSLNLLHVNHDGLSDQTELDDIKAVAQIAPDVQELAATGNTPYSMMLHRLATLTESLCLSWGGDPNPKLVKAWMIARCELLQLRIPRV